MATAPRQLMRREERVESILVAAARAFGRAGFAATSMEDIAAEAGVTKLVLYRHFDGKKELYEAVLARVSERLAEAFREVSASNLSAVRLRALLSVARADTDAFLLLFRHAAREPQFSAYPEQYIARVSEAAETWLSELTSDRVLLRWMARVAVHAGIETVIAWLEVGDPKRDEELLARADRALREMVQSVPRKLS
jgi:AcrR family transcriptional regulator